MAKRPDFFNGGFYHVYNRGTDKRNISSDDIDRSRFVYDIREFNDVNPVSVVSYRFSKFMKQFGGPTSIVSELNEDELKNGNKKKEPLVDIIAWALMPNHYHLLLRQRVDGGVSEYMKKLGTGYTMYFNERHARSGALFQGKYKAKLVDKDEYLRHLVTYIHLNPLAIALPEWEKNGSSGIGALIKELLKYKWSSLRDYLGDKNPETLISWKIIRELGLPFEEEQYSALEDWLGDIESRYDEISEIAIDDE